MCDNADSGRLPVSRRVALQATAAGSLALSTMRAVHSETPSSDVIRVGLIGAGGRGTGALKQTLSVPGSNAKLTAIADAFPEGSQRALKAVEGMPDNIDCLESRRFSGLDAYQKLLDHCDLVILATPPGFRPFHFEAAVKAGKHVFMEKPVCVDSYGARLCLETAKLADQKKLKVCVGLQRRYDQRYRETMAKIREGVAGEIVGGQVYWNGSGIWYRPRKPNFTEMQNQVLNWYHFNWLSGDHICEQHVHNIDIANWALGAVPESAYGVGGKQQRITSQPSEIYDHHSVIFTYPNGARIASQCRQFPGGEGRVDEEFQGTKGTVRIGSIKDYAGKTLWAFEGKAENPYQVEHNELHDAIRNDKPLNNAVYATEASFAAALGRLATYSGKRWEYRKALEMDYRTMPENPTWDTIPPVLPDKDGNFPPPMPASYKVVSLSAPPVS